MSHDGPLHYRRGNERDFSPTAARSNDALARVRTPVIKDELVVDGFVLQVASGSILASKMTGGGGSILVGALHYKILFVCLFHLEERVLLQR